MGQLIHKLLTMGLGLPKADARPQQAHTAVDVRTNGRRNYKILGGGHNGTNRSDAPWMKIRRRTGLANMAIGTGRVDGGEIQQLAYGLFFQREAGRQKNSG
jgi:hypothetical protein